jgi:hypothetical protein
MGHSATVASALDSAVLTLDRGIVVEGSVLRVQADACSVPPVIVGVSRRRPLRERPCQRGRRSQWLVRLESSRTRRKHPAGSGVRASESSSPTGAPGYGRTRPRSGLNGQGNGPRVSGWLGGLQHRRILAAARPVGLTAPRARHLWSSVQIERTTLIEPLPGTTSWSGGPQGPVTRPRVRYDQSSTQGDDVPASPPRPRPATTPAAPRQSARPVGQAITARSRTVNGNEPPRDPRYPKFDPPVLVVELAGCGHRMPLPVEAEPPSVTRRRTCRVDRPVLSAWQDTRGRVKDDVRRANRRQPWARFLALLPK